MRKVEAALEELFKGFLPKHTFWQGLHINQKLPAVWMAKDTGELWLCKRFVPHNPEATGLIGQRIPGYFFDTEYGDDIFLNADQKRYFIDLGPL